MKKTAKRALSIFLSVLLAFAALPVTAFAADGDTAPTYEYDLEIYCDGVPVHENGASEDLLHIKENEQKQLTVKYKGEDSIPSGTHVVWSSPTPYLVYVDQNGVITGRDSSKGAIMRVWVAENIETLWLIGPGLADSIYDWMDDQGIDEMDAEGILDMMQMILGPILGEESANGLYQSLMNTLNSMNVEIRAELVDDASGEVIAYNSTHVVCDKGGLTTDFIPNGTYITNHNEIPATVEVGYEMDLQAITTPLRLNMGVNWEVTQKSWIGDVASDIATVDENNHITFNKPGTVTITATPSTEGLYDKLSSTIEGALNAGQSMGDAIGWMLEEVFGMSVGAVVVDALVALLEGMVAAGNSVEDIIAEISDWILKYSIKDSVTVEVVENIPVTKFEIVGDTERLNSWGGTRQLTLANIEPAGAVVTLDEITWVSSNEDFAVIDDTGLMTIRGADYWTMLGATERPFEVSATVNGVKVTRAASVMTGNDREPTQLVVNGPTGMLEKNQSYTYNYEIYPVCLLDDGMLQDYNDIELGLMIDGEVVYGDDITDGVLHIEKSRIDTPKDSHTGQFTITTVGGGETTLYVRTHSAVGSMIGPFEWDSHLTQELPLTVYQEVTGVSIDQGDSLEVEVDAPAGVGSASAQLSATVSPEDATNKSVKWSSDNDKVSVDANGVVSIKSQLLWSPITATITATSNDDPSLSDSITVKFVRTYVHADGVTLNKTDVTVYDQYQLTATVTPDDAENKAVTWASDDENVVTVDENGLLTAVAVGDTTVTVTTVDGGYTAACAVHVRTDKTVLQEAIANAEEKLAATETPEPGTEEFKLYVALRTALNKAQTVNGDELATQDEVDQAITDLTAALDAMDLGQLIHTVQIVPVSGSDELSGEVIYHKTPWYQTWTSQTVELTVQTNSDAAIESVTWQYANWSVEEPEGNFEDETDRTVKVRPTFGVGGRSIWVQAVVTDVNGYKTVSDPVKVRFYNWDWQK